VRWRPTHRHRRRRSDFTGKQDLDLSFGGNARRLPPGGPRLFAAAQWLSPGEREYFYSALSHLLRGPLVGACGYLDFLFQGDTGALSRDQMVSLAGARDSSLRLSHIVDTFLDILAFELNVVHLERKWTNLNVFLGCCGAELDHWVRSEGRKLSIETPAEPVWADIDAQWLTVALREIASNALRVSPRGSTLRMALEPDENGARFTVTDAGPGVPPECLDWIFLPLTQLRRKTDPPHGERGGLGLALARRILHAHQGSLRAECVKPTGLKVALEFPYRKNWTLCRCLKTMPRKLIRRFSPH
jgi:K+-sensing histidine kinase KdpD